MVLGKSENECVEQLKRILARLREAMSMFPDPGLEFGLWSEPKVREMIGAIKSEVAARAEEGGDNFDNPDMSAYEQSSYYHAVQEADRYLDEIDLTSDINAKVWYSSLSNAETSVGFYIPQPDAVDIIRFPGSKTTD